MAGSLGHIVKSDGTFYMDMIENLGDAHEALEDCYRIIFNLAGGDTKKVSAACKDLGTVDPWDDKYGDDPREEMKI